MIELGQNLFDLLNAKQQVGNQTPVTYGVPGLSRTEIADIETQLGFRVPEDFSYLFQNLQDPGHVLFPWSRFRKQEYDAQMQWVLHGIEFDIEHDYLWLDRWGRRRAGLSQALAVARRDFESWPKLLPLYGHRFLAAEPCLAGNPVFSIMQTDIVYYGANLAHYLINEFVDRDHALHTHAQPIRRIDVWSDFVR